MTYCINIEAHLCWPHWTWERERRTLTTRPPGRLGLGDLEKKMQSRSMCPCCTMSNKPSFVSETGVSCLLTESTKQYQSHSSACKYEKNPRHFAKPQPPFLHFPIATPPAMWFFSNFHWEVEPFSLSFDSMLVFCLALTNRPWWKQWNDLPKPRSQEALKLPLSLLGPCLSHVNKSEMPSGRRESH